MKKKSLNAKKIIHNLILNHLKNRKIKKIFREFKSYLKKNNSKSYKIGVAVSGGPDSLALAFLSKCYSLENKTIFKFFIVDHGLRLKSSNESNSVKLFLKKFDINCEILKWNGKKPKSNIQGIARINRYKLLQEACKKKKINHLLVGHHLDDLYENFFIRLLRGSGLKGLSSFGDVVSDYYKNFSILRPLIKFKKKELIYLSKIVFQFSIQDPSNENLIFQRSRIRKFIIDLNKEGLNYKNFNLTIKNLKKANNALDFYVQKNIKENGKFIEKKNLYLLNELFFKQSDEIIFRSISVILKTISGRYYSPRGKSIVDLMFKINYGKINKFTLGGCYIEKVNKTILITKEN